MFFSFSSFTFFGLQRFFLFLPLLFWACDVFFFFFLYFFGPATFFFFFGPRERRL